MILTKVTEIRLEGGGSVVCWPFHVLVKRSWFVLGFMCFVGDSNIRCSNGWRKDKRKSLSLLSQNCAMRLLDKGDINLAFGGFFPCKCFLVESCPFVSPRLPCSPLVFVILFVSVPYVVECCFCFFSVQSVQSGLIVQSAHSVKCKVLSVSIQVFNVFLLKLFKDV